MERTVPTTGSEEIQLYMRTYYSLLRTTDEVQIQTLVETHLGMDSLLHVKSRDDTPDLSVFVYCSLRLPRCIRQTRLIVMGQSERVFGQRGYSDVEQWQLVTALGRRRRSFFDGRETLARLNGTRYTVRQGAESGNTTLILLWDGPYLRGDCRRPAPHLRACLEIRGRVTLRRVQGGFWAKSTFVRQELHRFQGYS